MADGVILRLDEANLPKADWPMVGNSDVRRKAEAGLHFGSAFPGNPNTDVVYDLFPSSLHHLVSNLDLLHHALSVDIWLGRSEPRQAVFTRIATREFKLTFIDNSMLFGGNAWTFGANAQQSRFLDRSMYDHTSNFRPSEALISQVAVLLKTRRAEVFEQIPAEWLMGDEAAFHALLDELEDRARMLAADQSQTGRRSDIHVLAEQVTRSHNSSTVAREPASAQSTVVFEKKPVQSELAVGGESKAPASLSAS